MEESICISPWRSLAADRHMYYDKPLDVSCLVSDRAGGWLNQSEACERMLDSFNLVPTAVRPFSEPAAISFIKQGNGVSTFSHPSPKAPPDSTRRECR